VNKKINPTVYNNEVVNLNDPPYDANQLKILTPVGIAIIKVAAVK
jgi:hypothetical protein